MKTITRISVGLSPERASVYHPNERRSITRPSAVYHAFAPVMLFVAFHLMGCGSCDTIRRERATVPPIQIHRFDRDLYQMIRMDTPELQQQIATAYSPMLKVIGPALFRRSDTQSPDFFERIVNYYSEPTLDKLYQDALKRYESVEAIETALADGFHSLQSLLPGIQIPAVYMHVSGLRQNVLVADSLLSISIDKYMGGDYPLYRDFFPDYRRRQMDSVYVVPDYLAAWLLSEYPFRGNEKVLLDRMIYEGKIKYILHQALSAAPERTMKYTAEEYRWCKENEKALWRRIIERKHLYTPDVVTTAGYFLDRPSTFIADRAPGNIGSWIGWQIVARYMDKTGASIQSLMMNPDCREILTKSKYKP